MWSFPLPQITSGLRAAVAGSVSSGYSWVIPNPAAMHLLPASPWEPCHRTNFQVHITGPASILQSPQTFQTLRILSPFSPGKSSSTGESMPLAPEWALELWPPLIMLALSIYLREALILWPKPS